MSRNILFGGLLTALFAALALVSLVYTPFDIQTLDIPNKLQTPSAANWLGTDHFGRDILSMIMMGARTSIAVAVLAVGIGICVGVPLGLLAAARRGSLLDEIIMRGNDLVFAFPSLVIAILITAIFGPSAINAIIAIGIFNIPVFARLSRGAALPIWERDFILAARVSGKSSFRISYEHILPNITNLMIVQGTIQFSLGILAEAALSYIGLGAQPPTASWGRMLADAQTLTSIAPHVALIPGLAIVLMVLGLNLLGDGLRDLLDPPHQAGTRMTLLSITNLTLSIGETKILHDVDLSMQAGEIAAITGESGSGKSMTALSVMGLLPNRAQTTGTITLDGNDILQTPEPAMCALRGNAMGMVFQEPMTALNPVQTIGAQVAETILIHENTTNAEAHKRAAAMLQKVGLNVPPTRYPHELSGGQRQRVVIAMAIALRPKLLIADEPTTALDVTTQARILDLLRDLVREFGMGLLIITHDLAVVADIADQIIVMQNGRVVEAAPTAQLLSDMQHPYTRALFAASRHTPPIPDPYQTHTQPISGAISRKPQGLSVENVVRTYDLARKNILGPRPKFRALNDVSFHIAKGERVGLVGESGCGKSTLTRAILGLENVQGGAITLDGDPVFSANRPNLNVRRKMQVVFQDPYGSFNPRHTVARLVSEPWHLLDNPPPNGAEHIARALTDVGLDASDADKYIHEFSGGQRQRIAIARALIIEPELIIFDEAVSALDVSVRAQVLDLISDLCQKRDLAYLFISHDLTVVRSVTDRVLVMQTGQIVEQGDTETVFSAPTHPYTKTLLAAAPRLPDLIEV